MKKIKQLIFIIIVVQSTFLIGQNIKLATKSVDNYTFIAKDLKLMNKAEMIEYEVQITPAVKMYDVEGATIDPSQINDLMISGNFTPLMFADEKYQVKAIVFRVATDEEKANAKLSQQVTDPNAIFIKEQFASDFEAEDMDGNKISLKALKGKVVVLTFWSTKYKTSIKILPNLNKVTKKYTEVVFLAITFDAYNEVKVFLKGNEFAYTHIVQNESIIADNAISFFPTHMILDQKGEIVFKKVGDVVKELDTKIALTLKGF